MVPHKKRGPGMKNFAGGSENGAPVTVKTGPRKCGAPDGARGGAKKKRSPTPPRSAMPVQGRDFLRGPGKSGALRAPKRTLGIRESFAPFIPIEIQQHESTMVCELSNELGPYEIIILGEWFLSLYPMTFTEGRIQVTDLKCEENMECQWSDDTEDNMDPEGIYISNIRFKTELEDEGIKAIDPTIDMSNFTHEYRDFLPLFEKETAD